MENLTQFISKLDKVVYTSVDGKTMEGELRGQKVAVSIELKMDGFGGTMPIQAVMRVRINEQHAGTWGSTCEEDNKEMVTWFVRTSAVAERLRYEQESFDQKQAKSLFASL